MKDSGASTHVDLNRQCAFKNLMQIILFFKSWGISKESTLVLAVRAIDEAYQ